MYQKKKKKKQKLSRGDLRSRWYCEKISQEKKWEVWESRLRKYECKKKFKKLRDDSFRK